jgi:hypothetical protein
MLICWKILVLASEDPVSRDRRARRLTEGDMCLGREGCPSTLEDPMYRQVVQMHRHMLEFCEDAPHRTRNYLHPTWGWASRLKGAGREEEGLQEARLREAKLKGVAGPGGAIGLAFYTYCTKRKYLLYICCVLIMSCQRSMLNYGIIMLYFICALTNYYCMFNCAMWYDLDLRSLFVFVV